MRWFWIDRFEEFESGTRAVAIKNVSLAEEHLHDHYPGFPVMPASLMMEGMAQTGGILLGEHFDFGHIVILAKVPKMTYHDVAIPGDQIRYEATLEVASEGGGMTAVRATVTPPGQPEAARLIAEGEIVFAHVDDAEGSGADQKNFVFELGLLDALGLSSDSTEASSKVSTGSQSSTESAS